jgi:hypothetical protein
VSDADLPKIGRPSDFTPEMGERICEAIADGASLRSICESATMPNRSTVFRWLADPKNADFRDQYARAREFSGDADADDVAHYSRQAADGKIEPAAATAAINGLKWSAGKRKPKVYGDKIAHVGGGPGDAPIRHQVDLSGLSDEELEQLELIRSKLAVAGGDQGGEGATGD